jgi:hypothetical protein
LITKEETTTRTLSTDDAQKLGIPTSLEDIFNFGEEGVAIATVIDRIIGGDQRDDFSIIQRTNLSKRETASTPKAITLAKYGITDILGIQLNPGDWEMPWLKEDIKLHLRACTSLDFHSIEKAVEALQSFKIKTEVQKETKLSQI